MPFRFRGACLAIVREVDPTYYLQSAIAEGVVSEQRVASIAKFAYDLQLLLDDLGVVVCRTVEEELAWYFVGEGRSFNDGAAERRGFQSTSDVSIFVDDGHGSIISPGTSVTFYAPDLAELLLDNEQIVPSGQGSGWLSVFLAEGNHDLEFIMSVRAPLPGDDIADGVVHAADYSVWRDHFGDDESLANDDTPGVTMEDFDVWKQHIRLSSDPMNGSPAVGVPEPTPLTLMLVAFTAHSLIGTVRGRTRIGPVTDCG